MLDWEVLFSSHALAAIDLCIERASSITYMAHTRMFTVWPTRMHSGHPCQRCSTPTLPTVIWEYSTVHQPSQCADTSSIGVSKVPKDAAWES